MRIINQNNYEEYLLDYVDGELNEIEQAALLEYIHLHPEVEGELCLLQKTKPETKEEIPLPDKHLLYHSTPAIASKKVSFRSKRRVLAAVSIAASVALIVWFLFSQQNNRPPYSDKAIVKAEQTVPSSDTTREEAAKNSRIEKTAEKPQKGTSGKLATLRPAQPARSNPITKEPLRTTQDTPPAPEALQPAIREIPLPPLRPRELQIAKVEVNTLKVAEKQGSLSPGEEQNLTRSYPQQAITGPLKQLKARKETLDSSLTDKVFAFHDKWSHPFKALNIKEVKIGGLSIVFN